MRRLLLLGPFLVFAACSGSDTLDASIRDAGVTRDAGRQRDGGDFRDGGDARDGGDGRDGGFRDAGDFEGVLVTVTLDEVPVEGAIVTQGGSEVRAATDANGRVIVLLHDTIPNTPTLVASHPDARMRGVELFSPMQEVTIPLERFDRSDNVDYPFGDPGEPDRRPGTMQCAHCHKTINEDWYVSPHRFSASNPVVHDLYAGVASAFDAATCAAAGGQWLEGIGPGTEAPAMRCYLGAGALEAVNPACTTPPCDQVATDYAGCADCHAPAMNGEIGGRNLLDAAGLAYDFGVSCDACHRVEDVVLDDAPGIAGRLRLLRPSEEGSFGLGAGGFLPLTFGPSFDSPNPRMGGSPRAHFRDATLCAGCHEHNTAPMQTGDTIDAVRWPSGELPLQSTYEEWLAGPMNPSTPCQECHMPPAAERSNGADLQTLGDVVIGISGGWPRAPGAVRQHSWWGPRQPAANMLQLAAAVFVTKSVVGGEVTATVRVKNVGAGHAIPTGEPMRTIALSVEAYCGTTALEPTGGDAVPDFGGALARKVSAGDWSSWPGAQVGDIVRVVARPGGFYDYDGPLSFDDITRTRAERGLPIETVAGSSRITAVNSGGVVFDRPLPVGDVAYLVRSAPAAMLAGAPGFAFARVLTDSAGNRRVPHFVAVDVASDNRLPPQKAFTTTHRFQTPCAEPTITARLLYRPYPHTLARERGWTNVDQTMVEVTR